MKTARLIDSPEKVAYVLATLDALQLPGWWSGLCVWISTGKGQPSPELCSDDKAALMCLGFEHSGKHNAWYLRANEGINYAPQLNNMARLALESEEAAA